MTLPFDHSDELDLQFSRPESSIHDHDIDFCVTTVAWVDLPIVTG